MSNVIYELYGSRVFAMIMFFRLPDVDSDFDGYNSSGNEEYDDFDQFEELETKTRFTNYSMSSSVMRRNAGLAHLDDQFEQVT